MAKHARRLSGDAPRRPQLGLVSPRKLLFTLAFLGLGASVATAQPRDPRPFQRATQLAEDRWRQCFADEESPFRAGEPTAGEDDALDGVERVSRVRSDMVILDESRSGSGVEAVHRGTITAVARQQCAVMTARWGFWDGAHVWFVRLGWQGAPLDALIARALAPAYDPHDPAHAFSRAWLEQRCPGGADAPWPRDVNASEGSFFGPVAPSQPWWPGTPAHAAMVYWPRAAWSKLSAPWIHDPGYWSSDDDDDADPAPAGGELGVVVPGLAAPRATFRTRTHVIYESHLEGRNGGEAIALYDRAQRRHRWVVATRGCLQGTTVKWLGTWGDFVVGATTSRHGRYASDDGLLLIDARNGTAWITRYPEVIRDARAQAEHDDVRARLRAGEVTLRAGGATATVPLAAVSEAMGDATAAP